MLLPLVASAHNIEVNNTDGVTIYYNYTNYGTELQVTFRGSYYSYSNEYQGNVVIPEEVTYGNKTLKVTSIGDFAFGECSGLTSITIPNSVTSIGNYAFENCSGLTSITIGNSVTSIGNEAFFDCSGLTSIIIPNSVTSIGSRAFSFCSGLTSIIVEPGNTEYDSRNNCNAIIKTSTNSLISGCKNTIIPNSVTSIGDEAFQGCYGLTSITIPNSVTSIGSYAFHSCSGLTSITIPNSVTSIGISTFYNCSGLTSITIPNSVTSIGDYAFYNCSSLLNVYCYAEQVPSTGRDVFSSHISQATLHVPANVVNVYQNTSPWKGFGSIVAIEDTETPKCEKPTISYENGRLTFDCETDDVEFVYDVVPAPGVSGKGNDVEIKPVFTVSVYATKDGYEDSEVTTKEISVEGGSGMKGDVNGDGEVGIGDIISITNIMAE